MSELPYIAPIEEQRFLLEHVSGLSELAADPRFAEATPELADAILEGAGDFASGVFAPLNAAGDHEGAQWTPDGVRMPAGYAEAYRAYVEGGWGALAVPVEYGGQGLPRSLATAVMENLHAANMAFNLITMLTEGGVEALIAHGSKAQQERWLPYLITGEYNATMNLTEPQAGSDVGAVRATATPRDDGMYAISGQKIFITFGEHDLTENVLHLVLARTPGSPAGTRGISMFLVPRFRDDGTSNNVRCLSIEKKMGIHASPTCVMSFGEGGECLGELVGAENGGMRNMFTMMNNARTSVGLEGIGVAERATQAALAYADMRFQFGVPIARQPDVQRMLLRMQALTQGSRALAYYAAGLFDRVTLGDEAAKHRLALLVPLVKSRGSDVGIEVANLGIQVHGGLGFIEETGVAQYLRDARIAAIYEGTNGIQAADLVSRKLPLEDGAVLASLLADIRSDEVPATLASLVDDIEEVCRAFAAATPEERLFGSAPLLTMLATAVEGWLMHRLARAATGPSDFEAGKRRVAAFHLAALVPEASGLKAGALMMNLSNFNELRGTCE